MEVCLQETDLSLLKPKKPQTNSTSKTPFPQRACTRAC